MSKFVCVAACFISSLAGPRLVHSVEPSDGPDAPPAKAEGSADNPGRQALQDAMEGFVSGILKQWLMENKVAGIALGNISNPPNASAGPLVQSALTQALRTEDIQLASEAQYQLRGDYYVDKAHNGTVSFNFEIVDTQDNNKETKKWPHLQTAGKPGPHVSQAAPFNSWGKSAHTILPVSAPGRLGYRLSKAISAARRRSSRLWL